jgi:hypothetical protein
MANYRCLSEESCTQAKTQLLETLKQWLKSKGLDYVNQEHIAYCVASTGCQYAINIGEETEVSAIKDLRDSVLGNMPKEYDPELFPTIVIFTARYAQIDAMGVID